MSFGDHVAFVLAAFGQKEWIHAIRHAEDPHEEVLKAIYSDEDIEASAPLASPMHEQ